LEALSRRIEERNEDDTERKKFLEGQVKEYIPAGTDVELSNKPDWSASEAPLRRNLISKCRAGLHQPGAGRCFP